MRFLVLLALSCATVLLPEMSWGEEVAFRVETPATPCVNWSVERLRSSLTQAGLIVTEDKGISIRLIIGPESITTESARKPEGFQLTCGTEGIVIAGYDSAGLMYGCLELCRQVRDAGKLPERLDVAEAPGMSLRGTCILLMKLGLYDYPVTPAEFPFFYDKALWVEYLDFLAENHFNYLAFWNGHPFDYFVKLDKYPEAQDGLEPGLLERNHDMLLWLAQEAEKRNIWLMFEFYNIHVSVYFAKAHNLPEHGISKSTPLLRDYTGYCIERFVSEFPSVGLYICPGESLELEQTPSWINDVIFEAVKRTGKTPPIMIRSWGIDLEHMKQVVGHYPRLYTERKFNVEMIASTEIDPENAEWAKLSGNHVVNIHCLGNLEPFRWSPPSYIQKCMQNSVKAGATGLHLYPRKAWRWPYGCDKTLPELQWNRDWMWFEAWGRYAWNADRDPKAEREYWVERLGQRFGRNAGAHVLNAFETSADVLPAIQRLVWLGNDNHTVVGAGTLLEPLQTAKGIPFLDIPDAMRIPDYIEAVKAGKKPADKDTLTFLAEKAENAWKASLEARTATVLAEDHEDEVESIQHDMQAQALVAKFYHHKLQAAVSKALVDAGVDVAGNARSCITQLAASLNDFRALTNLTRDSYESMSDVPAWNPAKELPCPYHWADVLPLYEKEFKEIAAQLAKQSDDPADLSLRTAAAYLDGYTDPGMEPSLTDATTRLILPLVAGFQRQSSTQASLESRKQTIRAKLFESYGFKTLPERTPLNARMTGRVEYPEYTLEKLVYEAWPGIPVSAHLYLPKNTSTPLPCVLYTCGHWYHGKTEHDPRAFCAAMARKGIAVLIYDPMGQGERYAENEHGHLFPILAGLSQEGFMVWECMRAIDYLESRPEIDAKRIGLTGASGGGLNTIFTAAVEERLAAAVPVCYPVTYLDFLCEMAGQNWNGGVDLCNQVPGVIAYARTSDLLAQMIPRPTLQISAVEDSDFPISGARQTALEVAAAYREAGVGDNFKYAEIQARHGYDKTMRETAYGFFLKVLAQQGDGSSSPEPPMEFEPWDDPKLRSLPEGENGIAGPWLEPLVKSMLSNAAEFGSLPTKESLTEWQDALRARIREICAVPAVGESTVFEYPAQSASDGIEVSGFSVVGKETVTGATESFDCSHFTSALTITEKPTEPTRAVVVLSKKSRLETLTSKLVRDLVDKNVLVCVPALTGLGENPSGEFELATNLWMLGRTLPGEWIAELERIVSQIQAQWPGIPVCLAGVDGMAETALLAAAIMPTVSSVAVDQPLVSYRDLISSKTRWSAGEYLPRVLQHFDLAQVIAAMAPKPVALFNPVDGFRTPCPPEALQRAYTQPRSVYDALKASEAFRIVTDKPFEAKSLLDSTS